MNLRNLERMLAREEEVKKRAVVHKEVYSGPQIRYTYKNGKHLHFSEYLIVLFLVIFQHQKQMFTFSVFT